MHLIQKIYLYTIGKCAILFFSALMRYFPNLALLLGGQTCLVDRHSQQLLQQVPTFLCTRAQANKDIFIIILRKKYFSRQKLFHNFSAKMYLLFIFPPKTTLLENSRQNHVSRQKIKVSIPDLSTETSRIFFVSSSSPSSSSWPE